MSTFKISNVVPPVDQQYAVVEILTIRDVITESKEAFFIQKFWKHYLLYHIPRLESIEQFHLKCAKKENFYADTKEFINDFFSHLQNVDLSTLYDIFTQENFPQLIDEYNKMTNNISNVVSFNIFSCFSSQEDAHEYIKKLRERQDFKFVNLCIVPVGQHIPFDKRYEYFSKNQEEAITGLDKLKKRQRQQDIYRTIEFNARKKELEEDLKNLKERLQTKQKDDNQDLIKNEDENETIKTLKKIAGFDISIDQRYNDDRKVSDQIYWEQKEAEIDDLQQYTDKLYKKYNASNGISIQKMQLDENEKISILLDENQNYDSVL